ncbi:MAG TPA: hypothetical protein VFJ76_07940 [Solirubrobacterales bacterium]|nr:hypothetical protein [Solirubrobacterales bacterium]
MTDLTISEATWRCHERGGPAHDGRWEFVGTVTADDAEGAARSRCIQAWAEGTHAILVVNSKEAREFRVTIASEEVTDGGA